MQYHEAYRIIELLERLQLANNEVANLLRNTIKPEDGESSDGDFGIPTLTVRQDTLSVTTGSNGEYQPLKTDALGRLWIVSDPYELLRVDKVDNSPNVGDTTYYQGFALPGTSDSSPNWRIKRIIETASGDVFITYAGGNANADKVWNNRLSLAYF
ncbi:MAG: hypothetical protein NZZ41_01340 [Candidatus Dojkabacteria bacterium]|nr:hypothetical protein [Candidatus Dojkabacteria bacterium]